MYRNIYLKLYKNISKKDLTHFFNTANYSERNDKF